MLEGPVIVQDQIQLALGGCFGVDLLIGEWRVICFAETLLPIAKNVSAIPVGLA